LISILLGGCSGMQNKAVSTTGKYPEKPITVIVTFSAGGAADLIARVMEKEAPKYLGQPLIVVNKPGSAGTIGWNEVAGARPDGYTVGITAAELLVLPLYGMTKYNYLTDLQPLAQMTASSWTLAVQTEQPWQNVDDLVNYARQHPGQLKFSHSGIGSFPHVIGEMIGKAAGTTLEQVPFRSSGEAITALLGGHVQVAIVNPATVKEHMKSGTVRVLAVTGEQRLTDPDFAGVPTLKEQGFDIAYTNWFGVAAPKDMPPEVKAKLVEGFKAMIEDAEFKKSVENMGLQVEYLGPQKSEEKWISDSKKISKTIQETGILDLIKAQKK
ncbi:MAG: tripartite tricarboxylate transporter substrate binding protein, partial [Veillonellales bacterium]